jgi:hypothetical protein
MMTSFIEYSLLNIVRVIISSSMSYAEHVARIEEERNENKISDGKTGMEEITWEN